MEVIKKVIIIATLLFLIIFTFGCGAQTKEAAMELDGVAGTAAMENKVVQSSTSLQDYDGNYDGNISSDIGQRKIIQNAEITIEVDLLEEKVRQIEKYIGEYGGYLGESNIYRNSSSYLWAHMVLRIPSANFDEFLNKLENLGNVKSRRIYRDDVTTSFIDMEARLRVLKAEEESLLGILEKADNIENVLNIRKELRSLRSDIEALEGELKYLTDRIDYSTINLQLSQPRNPETHIDAKGLSGVWQKGIYAFTKNINFLINLVGNFIVFFIGSLPILVPLAAVVGIGVYTRKKYKNKVKT